jgi:putative transposase
MLDYKLKEQGKQLIKIDKWYPSSKLCSSCGETKKTLDLSERTYQCEACGAVINRDYNASINIRREGMRLLLA